MIRKYHFLDFNHPISHCAGVQSINDAFHIVYTYIFNLIDNVECVVYALYSSVVGYNVCLIEM
jgi:hypothetical protein